MDIQSIQPTAIFKADLAIGQSVELEIEFMSAELDVSGRVKPGIPYRFSKLIKDMIIDAVVEWDTKEKGSPVPCTIENKRKHLPVILGLMLKDTLDEKGEVVEKGNVLGLELLTFASDPGNFLKN
jgi:hypothetical protein